MLWKTAVGSHPIIYFFRKHGSLLPIKLSHILHAGMKDLWQYGPDLTFWLCVPLFVYDHPLFLSVLHTTVSVVCKTQIWLSVALGVTIQTPDLAIKAHGLGPLPPSPSHCLPLFSSLSMPRHVTLATTSSLPWSFPQQGLGHVAFFAWTSFPPN